MIVSNVSPPASASSTTVTGVRVPRITGFPWQIFGSMTIRSSIATPPRNVAHAVSFLLAFWFALRLRALRVQFGKVLFELLLRDAGEPLFDGDVGQHIGQ